MRRFTRIGGRAPRLAATTVFAPLFYHKHPGLNLGKALPATPLCRPPFGVAPPPHSCGQKSGRKHWHLRFNAPNAKGRRPQSFILICGAFAVRCLRLELFFAL